MSNVNTNVKAKSCRNNPAHIFKFIFIRLGSKRPIGCFFLIVFQPARMLIVLIIFKLQAMFIYFNLAIYGLFCQKIPQINYPYDQTQKKDTKR